MKPTDVCSSEVSIKHLSETKETRHLPNSEITVQTRRALSTSPRLEPSQFAKDIADRITAACGLSVAAVLHVEHGWKEGIAKEKAGVGRAWKRSCQLFARVTQIPLVRAAFAPPNSF